eukprot:132047_1
MELDRDSSSKSDAQELGTEYHRLTESLAKSLSLPVTTTDSSATLQLIWKDKKAEKTIKKYTICGCGGFCLLIMITVYLLMNKLYIHPEVIKNQSSSNAYPVRNDTVLIAENFLNNTNYIFSYNQKQAENIEIYGILAFIFYGNNIPNSITIEYSLNNNNSFDSCLKRNTFTDSMSYMVAECDTPQQLFNYMHVIFKFNIDISNNAYYQLNIYYLLLSRMSVHNRYQISPFIEYNNTFYPTSRSYYFGMPKKQITDGTYRLNFVFNTNCENNTFLVKQCRIGNADKSTIMYPNYFNRADADTDTFCDKCCDNTKDGHYYHHVMDLQGGFDLMYLQDSGFWIVLDYTFDINNIHKYSPFTVILYMEKMASYWRSGEFIGAICCLILAFCVICVLIVMIKKHRKITKYTATHRKLYKRFYNERDAILYDVFGSDIAFIIKQYLNALEGIPEIKDETVWSGKMLNKNSQLKIN